MKSYTNKEGVRVEVSEEHLKTAVKIKKELQNASPSRKCQWSLLVKLMEKEGFIDAESNESYRCMIKAYQKEINELPEVTKYAEMVSEGKLESIKEVVGELAYEKREAQHVFKQLNKVKRDVIDFTLIAEQIGNAFRNHDFSALEFKYEALPESKKKMVVSLSDLHIGALASNDINTYNFEIAQKRMKEYLDKVVHECKVNNVSEVYLMNLGDVIEHPYMHNLAYNCEFNLAEQIVMASDVIIKFAVGLSEVAHVTVAGIAGNHDRLNENKNDNLDGDHAVKGVNKALQSFIDNAKPERITYEQANDYDHHITMNGINIKFVHGDLDNITDANLVAKHSSLDGINYTMVVMGHYHHHRIIETGFKKFIVGFGSLKGADSFGKKVRKISSVSQGIILIDEDGKFEIKRVELA